MQRVAVSWTGDDARTAYNRRPPITDEYPYLVYNRIAIRLIELWYRRFRRLGLAGSWSLYCLQEAESLRRNNIHYYHEVRFCLRLFDQGCKRYIAYRFRQDVTGSHRAFYKLWYDGPTK